MGASCSKHESVCGTNTEKQKRKSGDSDTEWAAFYRELLVCVEEHGIPPSGPEATPLRSWMQRQVRPSSSGFRASVGAWMQKKAR